MLNPYRTASEQKFLPAPAAADYVQVSLSEILALAGRGILTTRRVNGLVFVSLNSLDQYYLSHGASLGAAVERIRG